MTDQTQSTELVRQPPKAELVAGGSVSPIVPRNVDETMRYARWVCEAGLAPPSYEVSRDDQRPDPSKVALGIAKGSELGMPPMLALSTICIINKRPCLWGDGVVALLQNSGKLESWKEAWTGTEGQDDWTCTITLKRIGQAEPYNGRFSIRDAKRANLWNNPKRQPWMNYPNRMQNKRALAFAARDGFADVLCGLSIAEEIQDVPTAPTPVNTNFLDDDMPLIEQHQMEDVSPAAVEAGEAIADAMRSGEEAELPLAEPPNDWVLVADNLKDELAGAKDATAIRDMLQSKAFLDLKGADKETAKIIYDRAILRIGIFQNGGTGRAPEHHRDEAA